MTLSGMTRTLKHMRRTVTTTIAAALLTGLTLTGCGTGPTLADCEREMRAALHTATAEHKSPDADASIAACKDVSQKDKEAIVAKLMGEILGPDPTPSE